MKQSLRFVLSVILLLSFTLRSAAQAPTAKVYQRAGDKYYLGKLYIPKGAGKVKLNRVPKKDVLVELYFGHIDHANIYMMPMVVTEGYYYIDATNYAHALVVRTNTPDDVVMEVCTAEDDETVKANDSFYYMPPFSYQNKLRYTTDKVDNSVLQESNTYKSKNVYVMANPAKYGLAFMWIDQFSTSRYLPANSLYILGPQMALASDMIEVIWPDDEAGNATGVEALRKTVQPDGAIYNLQGQRVTSTNRGQIYIRNGRKFMAR